MDIIESLELFINNPNVAYLLLILSILGISVEILTPGLVFPSALGIILGILAFFGLSSLDINPPGLILIILSPGFFIAEALVIRARGILAALGVISILCGSFILFKGGLDKQANPFLIAGTAIAISVILAFLSSRITSSQLKSITTGREAIKGSTAEVRSTLNPQGMVYFQGELWKATLGEGIAEPGEEVVIRDIEGLKLFVIKKGGNS